MPTAQEPGNSPKHDVVKNETDLVNHPPHYGGADNPYEVIKVLENWLTEEEFVGALKFNIIKYNARARLKDGIRDLDKSRFYSQYLTDFLKRKGRA